MAIIQDPNTGLYIDNATGRTYQDAQGNIPSSNPSLTSQAQRNLQVGNELFARLGGDQQRYRQAFAQQGELARSLDNTIRGTGPSVVGRQLEQGVEAGRQQADSQAAGASGAAAPLARYGAIQASGNLTAEANQAGALARAQEVADAQRTKAAVLGQQASEANTASGVNVAGMNPAASTATTAEGHQADIDQRNMERWQNFISNLANGAGGMVARAGAA